MSAVTISPRTASKHPARSPQATKAAEKQAKELLRENPQQSNTQVRDAVGLGPNQHRVVERARRDLETEGVIPVDTEWVKAATGLSGASLRRGIQHPDDPEFPGEIYGGPYRLSESPTGPVSWEDALQQILTVSSQRVTGGPAVAADPDLR